MKQKAFKLSFSFGKKAARVEDPQKVVEFGHRLSESMKDEKRDFIKKSRSSAAKASKLVLNA